MRLGRVVAENSFFKWQFQVIPRPGWIVREDEDLWGGTSCFGDMVKCFFVVARITAAVGVGGFMPANIVTAAHMQRCRHGGFSKRFQPAGVFCGWWGDDGEVAAQLGGSIGKVLF